MTVDSDRKFLARLRQVLDKRFSMEELCNLGYDSGISDNELPQPGEGFARRLLAYAERHGHVPKLVETARRQRRDIEWDSVIRWTKSDFDQVPLRGHISAGEPLPCSDADFAAVGDECVVIPSGILANPDRLFAAIVDGESMVDASIGNGDVVLMDSQSDVRVGDIAAVVLTDTNEMTLKQLQLEDGQGYLKPANRSMRPFKVPASGIEIQGKLVGVLKPVPGKILPPEGRSFTALKFTKQVSTYIFLSDNRTFVLLLGNLASLL